METIYNATSENIKIFLVGNKSDLIKENGDKREVSEEMANNYKYKNQNVIKLLECSAKYKSNLIEPFEDLCKGDLLFVFMFCLFVFVFCLFGFFYFFLFFILCFF